MFQRLPIALAQVKSGNTSENILNEMCQSVSNKSFGQLLDISHENSVFLKTFNSEFSYIEVLFSNKNSKSQEIEDKINIALVFNSCVTYKK